MFDQSVSHYCSYQLNLNPRSHHASLYCELILISKLRFISAFANISLNRFVYFEGVVLNFHF